MSRYVNILPQYTIYLASETGVLDILSDITMDVIDGEIWRDTVTNFPTFDVFTNCYNLASTVGARNDILLLSADQWWRRVCKR